MRILEITPSVSRLGGGLFESVRNLAKAIHCGRQGQVAVLALEDDKTAEDIGRWAPLPVQAHKVVGPSACGFSMGLLHHLLKAEADVVHLHGLWNFTSIAVWLWARRTGKPYIVSPHGMLDPWALAQRRLKKLAALRLFQRRCLADAACLRATSALEAQGIRQAGFKMPIAVVPNGVHLGVEPGKNGARNHQPKRRALFLSRLHPKKGLLNLVEAWALVRPQGWELQIAGPDQEGHLAEVKEKAHNCGIDDRIQFLGEVLGERKRRLYLQSDLFVLPSFSENFGLVVAEALSCAVAVITTRATPWDELEERGCGWWVEVGTPPLVEALRQSTSLPPQELDQMGRRGRRLIRDRYQWGPIAHQMVRTYERITLGGRHPAAPSRLKARGQIPTVGFGMKDLHLDGL
jgi:glycosyltransferase involved in cell wall biosynthesis